MTRHIDARRDLGPEVKGVFDLAYVAVQAMGWAKRAKVNDDLLLPLSPIPRIRASVVVTVADTWSGGS